MLRITAVLTMVIVVVLIGFSACESDDDDNNKEAGETPTQQTAAQALIENGKGNITVTLSDADNSAVSNKQGIAVTLTIICGKDSEGKERNKDETGELNAEGKKVFPVNLTGEGWGDKVEWENCVFKATALVGGETKKAKVVGFNLPTPDGKPPVFVTSDILAAASAGKPFDINGAANESHYPIEVKESCNLQVRHFDGTKIKSFKGKEVLVLKSDNNGNITGFFAIGNPKADCQLALTVGVYEVKANTTAAPVREVGDDSKELLVFEIAQHTEVIKDISTPKDKISVNTGGTNDQAPAVLEGRIQPYFSNDNGETWEKRTEVDVAKWQDLGESSNSDWNGNRGHNQALLKVKADYRGVKSDWWIFLEGGNNYKTFNGQGLLTYPHISTQFGFYDRDMKVGAVNARVIESCGMRIFTVKVDDAENTTCLQRSPGNVKEIGRTATAGIEVQAGTNQNFIRGFVIGNPPMKDNNTKPRHCEVVLRVDNDTHRIGGKTQIMTHPTPDVEIPAVTVQKSANDKIELNFTYTNRPTDVLNQVVAYVSVDGGVSWTKVDNLDMWPDTAEQKEISNVSWNSTPAKNQVLFRAARAREPNFCNPLWMYIEGK